MNNFIVIFSFVKYCGKKILQNEPNSKKYIVKTHKNVAKNIVKNKFDLATENTCKMATQIRRKISFKFKMAATINVPFFTVWNLILHSKWILCYIRI